MPLVKCGECGKEISDSASHCPECGGATSLTKSNQLGIALLVIVLVIAGLMWLAGTAMQGG